MVALGPFWFPRSPSSWPKGSVFRANGPPIPSGCRVKSHGEVRPANERLIYNRCGAVLQPRLWKTEFDRLSTWATQTERQCRIRTPFGGHDKATLKIATRNHSPTLTAGCLARRIISFLIGTTRRSAPLYDKWSVSVYSHAPCSNTGHTVSTHR